jgi:membrane protease subunit HflK
MRSPFDSKPPRPGGDNLSQIGNVLRTGAMKNWPVLLVIVLAVSALTGIYSVGPGEQGVVRTFGRESNKTGPGLHYRFPLVQRVDVVNVEEIRRLEVGFRGDQRMPTEALMITGDENIVEAQMIVQYRVSDPSRYLFRLNDPDASLRATAEVALRSMVGRTLIDDVITTGREKVQEDTRAWLQQLMDNYESGLSVTEVKLLVVDAPDEVRDAFHDVVRAREEKERLINEAKGYQADLIPKARGEARGMEREAEAYKEQRVLRARGDAARFDSVRDAYEQAPRVTRQRMYLETMESIMSRLDRTVVVDGDVANGTLPVLPLAGAGAITAAAAGGER